MSDRNVEKISIDSATVVREVADFVLVTLTFASVMTLIARHNSNSNNRQLAQNLCDVIERLG